MLVQFAVSIWRRKELRDTTNGDPWDGRTLEWATSSPPPDYNFAFTPVIHDLDAWYDMKTRGAQRPVNGYRDIHMPSNTGTGMILSGFCRSEAHTSELQSLMRISYAVFCLKKKKRN